MYHKVVLIGNLTRTPEMRYTPNGTPVTTFTVATSAKIPKSSSPECPAGWKEGYGGNTWEQTIFWRVTAWRGLAEMVNEFLEKGRQVYVEGTMNGTSENGVLNPRTWTARDGEVRASFEVTAQTVKFLDRRDSGGGTAESTESSQEPAPGLVTMNDIPF